MDCERDRVRLHASTTTRYLSHLIAKGILLILNLAIMGSGSDANAYGHIRSLATGAATANLAYVGLTTHKINFCVNLEDGEAGIFTDESLDAQTRSAISLWLGPVVKEFGNIAVNRVSCDAQTLNLMIDVSPDPNLNKMSYEQIMASPSRQFSLVKINTRYRFESNGRSLPVYD